MINNKVFVSIALSVVAVSAFAQTADLPDVKVGDEWVYENIDGWKQEVTSTYKNKIVAINDGVADVEVTTLTSSSPDQVGKVTRSKAKLSTWTFDRANKIDGEYILLQFPLFPGKTWAHTYKFRVGSGDIVDVNLTAKVHSWEEVDTSFGKVKALKVEHRGNSTRTSGASMGRGVSIETLWYAPDFKRIVKRTFEDSWGYSGSVKPLTNVGQRLVSFKSGE